MFCFIWSASNKEIDDKREETNEEGKWKEKTNITKRMAARFMAEFQMPSNQIYELENDKNT